MTSDDAPQVRINYVHHIMGVLEKLPADKRDQIKRALPAETVSLLAQHKGILFVPFRHMSGLTEAMERVLGHVGLVEFNAQITADACKSGLLFKGVLGALTAVLSDQRRIIVMGLNGGWSMITKGCGKIEDCGEDGGRATIAWTGVPVELLKSSSQEAAWKGSIAGAYQVVCKRGVETIVERKFDESRMLFLVRQI
jgi:hypothetical protein